METGIWPAKEYLQYSTMMLYHSKINSEEECIAKNTIANTIFSKPFTENKYCIGKHSIFISLYQMLIQSAKKQE